MFQSFRVESSLFQKRLHNCSFEGAGGESRPTCMKTLVDDGIELWEKTVKTVGEKRRWKWIKFTCLGSGLLQDVPHVVLKHREELGPDHRQNKHELWGLLWYRSVSL